MTALIVWLVIVCCPCILVLGLASIVAVLVVTLSVIFLCFPILLILLTIFSGGTAAPITCPLLCVWGCVFCGVCYAITRILMNVGKDEFS